MIDLNNISGRVDFFFLRHGESEGNHAGIIQGRRDFRLSENGRVQSKQVGRWFQDKGIGLILHSPLARAEETAQIVSQQLSIDSIEPHEDLDELDTGIFTGLTRQEIQRRYPAEWADFRRESWESVPEAERIEQLLRRAGRFWSFAARLSKQGGGNILAVTHSGILQWIIKVTLHHKRWMPLFPMSNCGISQFTVNNRPRLSYYYEWTYINFHPRTGKEKEDSLFLK